MPYPIFKMRDETSETDSSPADSRTTSTVGGSYCRRHLICNPQHLGLMDCFRNSAFGAETHYNDL